MSGKSELRVLLVDAPRMHLTFLRARCFRLYCEDEQLIDLLMLANRYNVHRLVQLCEVRACGERNCNAIAWFITLNILTPLRTAGLSV